MIRRLLSRLGYQHSPSSKLRILLLVDYRGWAFDNSAKELCDQLGHEFNFTIRYLEEKPLIKYDAYDLIYVFFWGESRHLTRGVPPARTIKQVSSHRWVDDPKFGPCSDMDMVRKYLFDADTVICTSDRLRRTVAPWHPRVFHTPNGVNTAKFRRTTERCGALTIGWAGNARDPVKGLYEIIEPACGNRFRLLIAPGNLSHQAMCEFYNQLDVLAVASTHEGEPLTLLEAMACGCFPVCVDVGIVPELIRDRENGIIVKERTPEAFVDAFEWCEGHLEQVRSVGKYNATLIQETRDWSICAPAFRKVFLETMRHAKLPRFRNDDVSADTDLELFRRFCTIFWNHGLRQVHGITLRGRTNSYFGHEGDSVEYEGLPNIGKLPNPMIRELSADFRFENRPDLVEFLKESPDEIALHGYFHTDYSTMCAAEQESDMADGLELLNRLFPTKPVRYFIAPFNRTNCHTVEVARKFGLHVLTAEGIHLEENLHALKVVNGVWHRYHHHRFYPQSTFPHWNLSLEALDETLGRNIPLTVGEYRQIKHP